MPNTPKMTDTFKDKSLGSPDELRHVLGKDFDGLLSLSKELVQDLLADPEGYGDYAPEELADLKKGGRLGEPDSFRVIRSQGGGVTVVATMTMSHVDRYHMDPTTREWSFDEDE